MPVFQLSRRVIFPPVHFAEPDGLLAVGGDLSVERLLLAYQSGIFPWYNHDEPILWWSPNPRLVLLPHEFHVSRRLRRILKKGEMTTTLDRAFNRVVQSCADARGPQRSGTWITPEMQEAYARLHHEGYAHSVETWRGATLVGGLYGVAIGGCFFGESMFSAIDNASKVAFARLVDHLTSQRFVVIDCQMRAEHLVRMGAREISRRAFLELLETGRAVNVPPGSWSD